MFASLHAAWDGNSPGSTTPVKLSEQAYWNGTLLAHWDASTPKANMGASQGRNQILVRFTNDSCSACNGQPPYQDRNLYVDSVMVGNQEVNGASGWTCTGCDDGIPGHLYNNGDYTIPTDYFGPVTVTVHGTSDSGVQAHMQVFINGVLVINGDVPDTGYAYPANPGPAPGTNQVTIRMTNDSCSACQNQPPYQDRNLFLTSVQVNGQEVNGASGWSCSGCDDGVPGHLFNNGDYTIPTTAYGPVTVTAYGSPDNGVYPHMQILVNGQVVREVDVTDTPTAYSTDLGQWHFHHQDLLGTERLVTDASGNQESTFTNLPFGDGSVFLGSTGDPTRFALLDNDPESGTEHAQYRQYSSPLGRWLTPDPYAGSYDPTDPQSFNRYGYVGNNPLGAVDPSGLDQSNPVGSVLGGCIGAIAQGGHNPYSDVGCAIQAIVSIFKLVGLFSKPAFHGSLTPRPGQVWTEHSDFGIPASNLGTVSGILGTAGVGTGGCEFGSCGFQSGPSNSTDHVGNMIYQGDVLGLVAFAFGRLHIPYADPADENHRLFNTHNCGPGGGGGTHPGVDQLCAAHDACYKSHGVSALDNVNPFTSGEGMGSCDRLLCASLEKFSPLTASDRSGKNHIQQVFGCGYILK